MTASTPRHKRRPLLLWIALGLFASAALLGLWSWNRPLGDNLLTLNVTSAAQRPTAQATRAQAEPPPTVEVLSDSVFATSVAQAAVLPPANTPVPTAPPLTVAQLSATPPNPCGSGDYNILVLGSDTRFGDYSTGRADFIRAVRVNLDQGYVRIMSIPRDMWVPIPYLQDYGITEGRVNSAYSYGNYFQLPGGGVGLMAATLAQINLTFDQYLVVNFEAVEKGVDAIGGVDVYVPKDVDGTLQYQPYFAQGQYHMDGHTLMQYVRIRFSDNDLYRMDRQNQVLMAIREKLLSPAVVGSIPGLIDALLQLVYTDLTPAQVSALACFGKALDTNRISSLKIGAGHEVVGHTTAAGAQVLLPIYSEVAKIVDQFNAP
jgi:LCP family protein required for cell wall assembly